MILLKKLIRRRIGFVALTICASIFSIAVTLWWNAQLGRMINIITTNQVVSVRMIITAAITMLISTVMVYTFNLCSSWACETIAHDLRMGYAEHFSSLSMIEIENINAGEQLSKLQNEMADISGFLRDNLFAMVDDLIKFIGTFSWMLWINPKLTLFITMPVAIILGYTVFSSRIIGEAAHKSQQANAHMNGFAETLITIFPVLRLFNAASLFRDKYNAALEHWESAGITEERRRAKLMSLSALLSCIPLLLLFFIGGTQVIQGVTAMGTLYIFINLSGNVSGVMMNMPGRIAAFRRFLSSIKRVEPFVFIKAGRQKNEYLC